METPVRKSSRLQVISTKKLLGRRVAVRKELADEIIKLRKAAQTKGLPPTVIKQLQQNARAKAKAFRNSQRKHGAEAAEAYRDMALAIREKRKKIK